MTTNHYSPPFTDPSPSRIAADAIAAAARRGMVRDILTEYADQLTTVGAFADVTARDAHTVGTIVAWDVLHGDESDALRQRAAVVAEGSWGGWDNPHGVARAFIIAADVLAAL